jgi:hypothetical protein
MKIINELIGIFYVLPQGKVVIHAEAVDSLSSDNGFKDVSLGHYEFFNQEILPRYPGLLEDYAYYPRGRILYREEDQTYIAYADKCIRKDRALKEKIQGLFHLSKLLWRADEQYQCAGCNKHIKDDAETIELLKNS